MNTERPLLTARERAAGLARLTEIAEAHAAGTMTADQARHEIAVLCAPIRRRARRAARLAGKG